MTAFADALHKISPASIHECAPDHSIHRIDVGSCRILYEGIKAIQELLAERKDDENNH